MNPRNDIENINQHLLELAKAAGAIHADALVVTDTGESVSVRQRSIESIEREDSQEAGLRAFVETNNGLAFATASTSDLSHEGLKQLAQQVLEMARISEPDPNAMPPIGVNHPDEQAMQAWQQKHPYQAHGWHTEAAKQAALDCEQAALDYHTDISNSDGALAGFSDTAIAYASSDGFCASYQNASASLSVSVIAGTGENMQTDYAYDRARIASSMKDASSIGIEAAERTIQRLGAIELQGSRNCPIVFEPRVATSLLRHLISAINGKAVLQKRSFLSDSLHDNIFPDFIHILDDPDHAHGMGNRLFDGEGTLCKPCKIIENGVLQTFLTDRYAAKRLNMPATGHARRGMTGDIGIGTSNLILQPGTTSLQNILTDIQDGILITELMGFGVNGTTGDYSRGAAGFIIKNGQLNQAVQAFTIAGNLNEMFTNISHLGNDLTWFGSTAVPSICINNMTVAGQG